MRNAMWMRVLERENDVKRFVFTTGASLVVPGRTQSCFFKYMSEETGDISRKASAASLRAPSQSSYQISNFRSGEIYGPVKTKLRLYRKYSITLMRAWGKCLPLETPLFPTANIIS
jgi:hypothetical protein